MVKRALFLCCLVAWPQLVLAGPNEGGSLLLSTQASVHYRPEVEDYSYLAWPPACGSQDAGGGPSVTGPLDFEQRCAAPGVPVVSVPGSSTEPVLVWAYVVTPDVRNSRWNRVAYGLEYDPEQLVILRHGTAADRVETTGDWPGPGSGIVCDWALFRTHHVTEIGWFLVQRRPGQSAGVLRLVPHPVLGSWLEIADREPVRDGVVSFGAFGIGTEGVLPRCEATDAIGWFRYVVDETTPLPPQHVWPEPGSGDAVVRVAPQAELHVVFDDGTEHTYRGGDVVTVHAADGIVYVDGRWLRPPRLRMIPLVAPSREQAHDSAPIVRAYAATHVGASDSIRTAAHLRLEHVRGEITRGACATLVHLRRQGLSLHAAIEVLRSTPRSAYLDSIGLEPPEKGLRDMLSLWFRGSELPTGLYMADRCDRCPLPKYLSQEQVDRTIATLARAGEPRLGGTIAVTPGSVEIRALGPSASPWTE